MGPITTQHDQQLQQAHHHPAYAFVGFFEQWPCPSKGDGLHPPQKASAATVKRSIKKSMALLS
jgi:hypothetical protein